MSTPLKIQIIVDDDGSVKVRRFGQEAEKAGHKGETSFKKTGKSLDQMNTKTAAATSHILKLAAAAVSIGVLYIAIKKIARALEEYTKLAGEQITAETRLQAVIKATGYAAGFNIDQLKSMASAMQKATTTGDEMTLKGMAILATFKQIRGEGFERATMAALDMADVMEGGLNGALVMIGKALNDPIANLSAMTRAGVQFTQGQKDTIKTLWEAGDTMAAQGIILKELESQFGGAAKAARETFPGALKATENALGDVKEEIGFIIVKNQAFVESLGIVEQWLIDLGEEIRNNKTDLRDMAKNGMLNLVDAMVLGVQAIGGMVSGLKSLSGYVNLIQSIWLKMKEINILIADPFGRDKIWQQMLAEVRQAQVDLAVANVELAVSISGTDEATAAIVARLHELRDKLDAVDASSGDAAATLGTVVVPALEAAGEVASGSKKDLEAFANAMNIINNITINDFFDWEGLTKFKKDMEWINSQQFEAAVTVALGDSDSDIKDLMAKLEKLKDIGSEPLFKSSIFGDSANQDLQNFMSSLEKVFDMYGEIKDREAEIVQLRAEAGAVQDEEKRADALKAIKELEVAYADKAIEGQIAGYRQLFGTSKQMFAENSKAREAMHIAELSMAAIEMGVKLKTALANAIVATTAQGSVPIAGFAMVAAMAAMMGMLLAQIGGSMSGVSGTAVDTGPALPASTVLGGEAGQGSESIANAFDMLEEFHAEEYGELIKIYNELKDLNQNITGLVTAIVRSGIEGFAGGSVTTEATFAKDVAKYTIDPVSKFVTEYVGNLLFGGEVTTTILRAGLDVWGMSMKDALAGFSATVKSFVGVKTEESSGWISGGSYSYGETSGDVDSEITRFFTMIYQNVAESFVSLSEGLFGKEGEQLIGADGLTNLEKVKEYMIGIGRIDLMGLDSDGINKAISEAISNMTDTMAKELFGDFITQYQQIGEGLYETAVRLVMQKEIVLDVLEMTGKAFVAVASDTVSAAEQAVVFSQALIEIAGSLEELTDAASTYFDAFFSDAEKQAVLYGQLTDAFDSLNMTLPDTREGYKALVESLAGATDEASMEAYVALLKLADAADAYYKSLEKATNSILDAQKKLAAGTAYDDIIAKYGLGNLSISQLQAIVDLFANADEQAIHDYLISLGYTEDQIVELTNDILTLNAGLEKTIAKIKGLYAEVNAAIAKINWQIANPEGGESDYIYSQLVEMYYKILESPNPLNLETGAQLLNDWYFASMQDADAAAQGRLEEERLTATWAELADKFVDVLRAIDDTIRSIKYSSLNIGLPKEKLQEAFVDEAKLFATAKTGDATAVQDYLSFAPTYLQLAQDVHKSGPGYTKIYNQVMANMAELENIGAATPKLSSDYKDAEYKQDIATLQEDYKRGMDWITAQFDAVQERLSRVAIDFDFEAEDAERDYAELQTLRQGVWDAVTSDAGIPLEWGYTSKASINFDFNAEDAARDYAELQALRIGVWNAITSDAGIPLEWAYTSRASINFDFTYADAAADYAELTTMAAQVVAAINAAFPDSVSKTIAVNIDYGYNGIGGGLPTLPDVPPSPGPMYHPSRAYGGMTYGPESGYIAELHGNELVVSPKVGYPATVISGGSNQQGAQQPINITIEVAGEHFYAQVDRRADNIRVKAEKQKLGKERMFV